jgi:hypothetical protein
MRNYIDIATRLSEMVAMTDQLRQETFYHGTPQDDRGQSILEQGIRPGNVTAHSRGHLTPIIGRSYLTPSLKYGVIYCIGGNMLGCSETSVKYLINRNGRYGWLFVVAGTALVNDIQPDEDSVGHAVALIHAILKGSDLMQYYQNDPLAQGLQKSDRAQLAHFQTCAKAWMTPTQYKNTVNGVVAGQASGGKRMLRKMYDTQKHWLINCGAHIAYEGPIQPAQAWRFDKTRSPQLAEDGSNFFDLAERIR